MIVNGKGFFRGAGRTPILLAADSILIVADGGVDRVSTNYGYIWHTTVTRDFNHPETSPIYSQGNFIGIEKSSDHIVYVVAPGGALETSDGGASWHQAPVPVHTAWYRYLGADNILALEYRSETEHRLKRSSNRGASWVYIDTMRFVNHDTTFLPDIPHDVRRDGNEVSATYHFTSGAVVSTTDAGVTWIYRGRTMSEEGFGDVKNELTDLPGKGSILPQGNHYLYLPAGSTAPLYRVGTSPYGIPIQMSDSVYLLANSTAMYKSIDGGNTWYILDEELPGHSGPRSFRGGGVGLYGAEEVWWGREGNLHCAAAYEQLAQEDGDAQIVRRFGQYLVQGTAKDQQRWFYAGTNESKPNKPMSASNFLQPTSGLPSQALMNLEKWYVADGERWPGRLQVQAGRNELTHELERGYLHYAWQVQSGHVLAMADSILISTDTGRTWRALASVGLPLDSAGNINTVTSFCEGPGGEWYMGLAGATYIDSMDTEIGRQSGGVVRSLDRGATWQPYGIFPVPTHVFHVACDARGVVYASTTMRTYKEFRPRGHKEADFMLQLYRVAKDTAEMVYSEYHSGPPSAATGVLQPDQHGAMLYATKFAGLQRSTDGGATWWKIGTDKLDTLTLLSIAVSSNNKVFVGASDGVYDTDIRTSDVHNGNDFASRRTTVWCYPTPATNILRVRLNNMDLLQGSQPRLSLCTIRGNEVLNLSAEAMQSMSTQRTEFDVDVTALPQGTYALILQAGRSSSYSKVLITK